jgi:glutamine amidotransferase-like uncharacterized protein
MSKHYPLLLFAAVFFTGCLFLGTAYAQQISTSNLFGGMDVVLFYQGEYANAMDIKTYRTMAHEEGLATEVVDYRFINSRKSFFKKNGERRFEVLILPGGEPFVWFERRAGKGITCQGAHNILDFISSGGSVIAICICSPSIFATRFEFENPNLQEAQRGEWQRKNSYRGAFQGFCGVHAFKGELRGPQDTNKPYPKNRMLPIRMNPDNEIVRQFNLPPVIYQLVVGGGSIITDEGQALDVVGWYPNDTAAIGIVPYGQGRIIMSNPHPNITGEEGRRWRREQLMGDYARKWGWTEEMLAEELKRPYDDPDGPEPDRALAKAMLLYAYQKASQE